MTQSETTSSLVKIFGVGMLALRQANKQFNHQIKESHKGPYKNKLEFTIAVTGMFTDKKYYDLAWALYSTTVFSTSKEPAMLYKLRDLNDLRRSGKYDDFEGKDNLMKSGRRYCPGDDHAWNVNEVWLMAQFHIGRSFALLSRLDDYTSKRQNNPVVFSALAKEIAAAMKAGYTVNIDRDGTLQLEPTEQPNQLTIQKITPTNEEIDSAVKRISAAQTEYFMAKKAVKDIKALVNDLEEYDLNELQELKNNFTHEIAKIVDQLFLKSINKNIIFNSFIYEFNKNIYIPLDRVNDKKDPQSFFNSKNIFGLKTEITNIFLGKIEAKIALKENEILRAPRQARL